jgi:hypothetical protein
MTIVRTAAQARGLQRCSTSPCVVCGRDSRLGCVAYFEEWLPSPDGTHSYLSRATGISFHHRVCARHQHFTGIAVLKKGYGQVTRYVIVEAASPITAVNQGCSNG